LDIRCVLPPPFYFGRSNSTEWRAKDGNISRLGVKTIEHLDIIKEPALSAMAAAVSRYAETGEGLPESAIGGIDTFSGKVCKLLEQAAAPDASALAALMADSTAHLGRKALLALQFMALVAAEREALVRFWDDILLRHPDLATAHYARSRLKAVRDNSPRAAAFSPLLPPLSIDLSSFAAVDFALRLRTGARPGSDARWLADRVIAISRTVGLRLRHLTRRMGRR
ncbi:MAG: hypothetical protein ABIO62_06375, partial [Paracoccaceae bacterium]